MILQVEQKRRRSKGSTHIHFVTCVLLAHLPQCTPRWCRVCVSQTAVDNKKKIRLREVEERGGPHSVSRVQLMTRLPCPHTPALTAGTPRGCSVYPGWRGWTRNSSIRHCTDYTKNTHNDGDTQVCTTGFCLHFFSVLPEYFTPACTLHLSLENI